MMLGQDSKKSIFWKFLYKEGSMGKTSLHINLNWRPANKKNVNRREQLVI